MFHVLCHVILHYSSHLVAYVTTEGLFLFRRPWLPGILEGGQEVTSSASPLNPKPRVFRGSSLRASNFWGMQAGTSVWRMQGHVRQVLAEPAVKELLLLKGP